jgi:hypothetical protein
MHRSNEPVVWVSILAFSGVMISSAVLSGSDTDWANARHTVPLVLSLVLILVVNRWSGPAHVGPRTTPKIPRFRIAPTATRRRDSAFSPASDPRVRPRWRNPFGGRS